MLDEIEKANASLLVGLLPFLAGDTFKPTYGKTASFDKAWFVFTTNLGVEFLDGPQGTGTAGSLVQDPFDLLRKARTRASQHDRDAGPALAPEFVSRLATGRAVIFRRPSAHHLWALADRSAQP